MAIDINNREARSGRMQREDNRFVNVVDKGGLKFISEANSFVHEGVAFGIDIDSTLVNGASIYLLGVTTTKEIHFEQVTGDFSTGGIRFELFEGTVTTAGGAAVTAYALNRASSSAQTMVVTAPVAGDITSTGTKIGGAFLPLTGSGAHIQPASGGMAGGRVLKTGTKYLIKITNESGATVSYGIGFVWGEPEYVS